MSVPAAPEPGAEARGLRGLLFDKDGTLFGFQATWGGWAADLVERLADGESGVRDDLAARIRLDLDARLFDPGSPIVAGTVDEAVALMLPALPGWEFGALRARVIDESRAIVPVEAVPLAPLLSRLGQAGYALGIATNDAEEAARAQLAGLGLGESFPFLAGADSGHGAKPGPGQCLAFAAETALAPEEVAMIGDSTHDLHAGRAAGMVCVAVLTGTATADDLAPHADAVLPDIGHLPGWLGL
ncbi:HAD family hydrolase [Rhodovulum sp. 12E13]|uniref:HAD family hydrolase n=1 Tax=Rhodovulum sp. 12E13 TaxID=2203891 RepID=UPI001F330840|nr:HAD family hydrolase [Rhodovulum sp. 12E13]